MLVTCGASCFVPDLPRFDDHAIDNSNHDHLVNLDAATGGGQVESMNGRVRTGCSAVSWSAVALGASMFDPPDLQTTGLQVEWSVV